MFFVNLNVATTLHTHGLQQNAQTDFDGKPGPKKSVILTDLNIKRLGQRLQPNDS